MGEQTLLEGRSWAIVKWGNRVGERGQVGVVSLGCHMVGAMWEWSGNRHGPPVESMSLAPPRPRPPTGDVLVCLFVLRCHTYNGKSGNNGGILQPLPPPQFPGRCPPLDCPSLGTSTSSTWTLSLCPPHSPGQQSLGFFYSQIEEVGRKLFSSLENVPFSCLGLM